MSASLPSVLSLSRSLLSSFMLSLMAFCSSYMGSPTMRPPGRRDSFTALLCPLPSWWDSRAWRLLATWPQPERPWQRKGGGGAGAEGRGGVAKALPEAAEVGAGAEAEAAEATPSPSVTLLWSKLLLPPPNIPPPWALSCRSMVRLALHTYVHPGDLHTYRMPSCSTSWCCVKYARMVKARPHPSSGHTNPSFLCVHT